MSKTPTTVNFEIKPLNEQEYSAAPEAVRRLYISVLENIPLSTAEIKTTIKAHPEYFRLKQTEVPKTFGQKVKRLFALKNAIQSHQKNRMIPVSGTQREYPGTVEISGEVGPDTAEQLKKLIDSPDE